MSTHTIGHEYEFEPQYGLPERLPADERIIWQVSPDVPTLAKKVFHIRELAAYFSVLLVARAAPEISSWAGLLQIALSLKWLFPLSVFGLASVWFIAWMTARTTVYTLTNKRVVMRLGIVLTVTFNLPFSRIAAAALRKHNADAGDITLTLQPADHIAWLHLWPSVRPFHLAHPQPMLRCVSHASRLAAQLSEAWSVHTGIAATGPVTDKPVNAPPTAHPLRPRTI